MAKYNSYTPTFERDAFERRTKNGATTITSRRPMRAKMFPMRSSGKKLRRGCLAPQGILLGLAWLPPLH